MKDLNGHYCLATKLHYDKLVEDGYKATPFDGHKYIKVIDDHIYFTDINSNSKPMHLHNNSWVFDSLEHEATDNELLQEFCDAGTRLHKAVENLKPKPVKRITREELENISEGISKGWSKGYNELGFEIAGAIYEYLEAKVIK